MAAVTVSMDVPASPAEVWNTVSNLEKAGDWLAVHDSYPDGAPEEVAEGTSYKQSVKIMGMPGEVTWTVNSIEEQAELSMSGVGPMGTTLANTIKIVDNGEGGSTVTFENEFGGPALAAMEGPLTAASKKAAEDSLEKLKSLFS